jgi:hypothetical protein
MFLKALDFSSQEVLWVLLTVNLPWVVLNFSYLRSW